MRIIASIHTTTTSTTTTTTTIIIIATINIPSAAVATAVR